MPELSTTGQPGAPASSPAWRLDRPAWWGGGLLLSLGLGALLAGLVGAGSFLVTWLLYSLFLALGLLGAAAAARLFGADAAVLKPALAAWAVRLAAAVLLILLLPPFGNDNPASNAGYLFDDSFRRDTQAWDLAVSGEPLLQAFSGQYSGDQYGGMLAFSAFIYRYLSPDAHRALLILILGAAAAAWGVVAAWSAGRAWFGEPVGLAAGWIMALYPESVLLGASHMREAFVIPLVALALCGLVTTPEHPRRRIALLGVAAILLLFVQTAAAVVAFVTLAVLWLFDPQSRISWRRLLLVGGVLAVALLVLYSIWAKLPSLQWVSGWGVFTEWLNSNFNIQATQTVKSSGWLQSIMSLLGDQVKGLVIVVYGIFRPVLPAALISPGAWIMRLIETLRAAGWYALAPCLLYGLWLAWRRPEEPRQAQLRWLFVSAWGWVVLASMNAGGDQWDNPRYRAMLLALQAVAAAWVWVTARREKERWFYRLLAIEGVFVVAFSLWYVARKYISTIWVDLWLVVGVVALLSAGIVVLGIRQDHKR